MSSSAATGVPPPRPPRFRLLLDESIRQVRVHFHTIFVPVAVPLALLSGVLPAAQAVGMGTIVRNPGAPEAIVPFTVIIVVLTVLWLAVYLFAYTAMLVAAVDAAAGRPVSMAHAWRMAVRPRIFLTMILSWLAIGLGAACCCLPGIYVALLQSVLVPVLVEERESGTDAMVRSAALVTHNPSRDLASDPRVQALVIIAAGFVLSYALSLVVQLPFVVAQQVMFFRSVGEGRAADPAATMQASLWLQVPAQVLGTLAQMVVQLFMAFALALFYFDLRRRKEGEDLQVAIDRLAGAPPAAPA